MVLVGIGLGLSSLIGHNIGSGKLDRAKKTADSAVWLGIAIMSVFALVTFFFARQLMGLFFESPETVAHGVTMLRIFALCFPFIGAWIMMEQIHVGVGLNTPAMVMNIIHSWLMQALPVFVFTQIFGFTQIAIWWIISTSAVISTGLFYLYYRRGRWMTVNV